MSQPTRAVEAAALEYVRGESEAARDFERELERLAASDVTVLLEGESGSGKGVAARRLHERGARAAGPFVEVSLAALTPTLLEAELFGHEAGAFTGAYRERRGRFLAAHGGSLLLDSVEALPEALQVKLLRVLQEREVEPLGSDRALPVDVRVIATTSRGLSGEVRAGRFREDLYYRLAVVTLRVPPLRARRADLPLLVVHLTPRVARRVHARPRPFEPEALERLARHAWPGNVRELENAIERVLVLAPGTPGAPVAAGELDFLDAESATETAELARRALALGLSLERLEQALIEEALAEERGNSSAAARRLGLTRRALEYRRRRAGGEASGEQDDDEHADDAEEA